jgi:hypothetical protein
VTFFEAFLIWMFAPTACVVALACVLSVLGAIFGFKPPRQRNDGWFRGPNW